MYHCRLKVLQLQHHHQEGEEIIIIIMTIMMKNLLLEMRMVVLEEESKIKFKFCIRWELWIKVFLFHRLHLSNNNNFSPFVVFKAQIPSMRQEPTPVTFSTTNKFPTSTPSFPFSEMKFSQI